MSAFTRSLAAPYRFEESFFLRLHVRTQRRQHDDNFDSFGNGMVTIRPWSRPMDS